MIGSGGLDSSFGAGGIVGNVFAEPATVVELLLRADWRVLVIATFEAGEDEDAVGVVRLLADGSLDPSFGVGGRRVVGCGSSGPTRAGVARSPARDR